jgi:hypothetical protein
VEEFAIDWSTAEVSPRGSGFDLRVSVTGGAPDKAWAEAFKRVARENTRGGWGETQILGERIQVADLSANVDDADLRRFLNEAVQATHMRIAVDAGVAEDKRLHEERQRTERETTAADLTKRFRTN